MPATSAKHSDTFRHAFVSIWEGTGPITFLVSLSDCVWCAVCVKDDGGNMRFFYLVRKWYSIIT